MVDTNELTKHYYSIGEVADLFGVSASLVRYWETEFSYLKPQKTRRGDRRFTKENIEQLNTIYHLVKEKGYTLDGAKREIKEAAREAREKSKILKKLHKLLDKMQSLHQRLG